MRTILNHSIAVPLLFQHHPIPMWIYDNETLAILAVNAAAVTAYGYQHDEFLALTVSDLYLVEEYANLRKELQYAPHSHAKDCRHRHKDGRVIDVELSVYAIEFNQRVAQLVMAKDITAHTQAVAELRKERDLLRLLIDTLPDAIYIKDRDGRFLLKNYTDARRMGATSADATLGKTDFDYYPAELAARYHADDQAVIAAGHALINQEEPIIDATGHAGWVSTTKVPLRDQEGHVVGLVGIGHDITALKHSDAALRASEARFAKAFHANPSGVVITRLADGQVLDVNESYQRILGYHRDEVLGTTGLNLAIFADPVEREMLVTQLTTHGFVRNYETTLRAKSGNLRQVLFSIELIEIDATDCALSIFFDMTERLHAEAALQRTTRRLQVLADASRIFAMMGTDYQALLNQVAQTVTEALGESCIIRLLSEDGVWLPLVACYDVDPEKNALQQHMLHQAPLRMDEPSFTQHILRTNQPLLIPILDLAQAKDATRPEYAALMDRLGVHSRIGVPMRVHGAIIGTLAIHRYRSEQPAFNEDDVTLAQDLADRAALAISNARLLQQAQHELAERLRIEHALRAREQAYRHIIETAQEGICLIDAAHTLTFANAKLAEILGYSLDELVGAPLFGFMDAQSQASTAVYVEHWHQGIQEPYDCQFRRKDNMAIWVMMSTNPLQDDTGVYAGVLIMVTDITTRKQAEAALRESERFARATVDALSAEIAILDATGTIIAVNQAWRDFMRANMSPSAPAPVAEGLNYLTICEQAHGTNAEEADAMLNGIRAVMSGQQTEFSLEYACHAPHEQRWFAARVTRFSDEGALRMVVAHENITDRKRTEVALAEERMLLERRVTERTAELNSVNAELTRAVRLKDEFLASMSHELRTPLTAVLGMAESLQEEIYGPLTTRQRQALQTIEESGHHLLELINDILDVAKIDAGKLVLDQELVAIPILCQSSLRLIQEVAKKKQITMTLTIDSAVTFLSADVRRLKQILVNLLSNAVKFTPPGGAIGLDVVGDGPRQAVDLTVWDTGIGIRHEDLGRLFKPFVQLDARLARQYNGTGLGLTLVYRMAELHGGGVRVESTPGVGSRFTVSLPWITEQLPMAALDLPAPHAAGAQALPSIIVADDSESNLSTLRAYLQTQGYQVVVARTGAEAVALVRGAQPALILMDLQMPEMDGLEAIRRIRTQIGVLPMPIIAMTALDIPGDRQRCLAAGANAYLSKPISLVQLATLIDEQLQEVTRQGDETG